jgi:hypothetical protein
MALVELKDAGALAGMAGGGAKGYAEIYRDVRGAVDLCHRDGSIKREVAADPGLYIHPDPGLVPLLRTLRAAGKRVFLATNSLWDYTNVVMSWWVESRGVYIISDLSYYSIMNQKLNFRLRPRPRAGSSAARRATRATPPGSRSSTPS